MANANPLFPAERAAFAPLQKISPADWGEEYRVLPTEAAEPGPYRLDRTPYWREILNIFADRYVEEIVIMKAHQVGFSTLVQNLLGWCVDNQPAPMMCVMPSQEMATKLVREDIEPLIANCDQLKSHNPKTRKRRIQFDTCSIYLANAGSPSSLASRPIRYVFLDEVDKYPRFAGKDADPISLAIARTTTFRHRRKVLLGSTPTWADNHVNTWFQSCIDKRYYSVPCPHCGQSQVLNFDQIRWPDDAKKIEDRQERAEYIAQHECAWYECQHCKGKILDKHKPGMLLKGKWLSNGVKSKRVAFHISAVYSPWVSFSQLATKFLRAITPSQLMEFRNQWLGLPWEEITVKADVSDLKAALKTAPPPMVVPDWASILTTAVDCQKDSFYMTIRAWGANYKSQLVVAEQLFNLDEVHRRGLMTTYRKASGHGFIPMKLLIDSGGEGDMTQRAYQFSKRDPRIICVKGASKPLNAAYRMSVAKMDISITLCFIDTQAAKDRLVAYRKADLWLINNQTVDEYFRHLAAEHKIRNRRSGKILWTPLSEGIANHYLDCEVYQIIAADLCGVGDLRKLPVATTPSPTTDNRPEKQRIVIPQVNRRSTSFRSSFEA